jgi:hypothetical protein
LGTLSTLVFQTSTSVACCPGRVLSIEVFDSDRDFCYVSAIGPVSSHREGDDSQVLAIDLEDESAAIVTNSFCPAREYWEGWGFGSMGEYLEAVNRPHPDAEDDPWVEDGPGFVSNVIITDTATGRSELLADFAPKFRVRYHPDDGSYTCKGEWESLISPRWGGNSLDVRVKFRVEPCVPEFGEYGPVLGAERMYQVRDHSAGSQSSLHLEFDLPSRAELGATSMHFSPERSSRLAALRKHDLGLLPLPCVMHLA